MSMASEYLNLNEESKDQETVVKFKNFIEELNRKPVQVRSDTAVALLDIMFDKLETTTEGSAFLKEFEETARQMITPETTDVATEEAVH